MKIQQGIVALTSRLAIVVSLTAGAVWAQGAAVSTIADNESGTNQNNLGAYWYVYNDSEDGGNSEVTNATEKADGTYEWSPTANQGNPSGTPGYGAVLAYQMGDTQPLAQGQYPYGNMVGIGTQLAPDGEVADITGATKITYWAKASAQMTVRVEVATATVTDAAYHRTEETITASWAQYEIILTDGLGISQPSWTADPKVFDPAQVEKVQWQVSMDYPSNPTTGSLYIDDVQIDLALTPWDMCRECVGVPGQNPTPALLTDFDTAPTNQNAYGFFAYCYNDVGDRTVSAPGVDYSDIYSGVTPNALNPTKPEIEIEGNGYVDNGAYIEFELGPTFEEGGETILPFVGIGTGLHNEILGEGHFNAAQNGATGVYFDYKTTGGAPEVVFEVKTSQVFPNTGAVHYIKLPATNGEWKGATIPFSILKLPRWEDIQQLPASQQQLDKTSLAKLQWAIQGQAGLQGSLAVDNVYFLGMTAPVTPLSMNVARYGLAAGGTSSLRIAQTNEDLHVRFRMPVHARQAAAELLSLDGKRIAFTKIAGNGMVSATLPMASRASAGMYVLTIRSAHSTVVSVPVPITN